MHELGVLTRALARVQRAAEENGIAAVRSITLEMGEYSGFVGAYFMKLFPAAREMYPATAAAELKLLTVPGRGLIIKELSY